MKTHHLSISAVLCSARVRVPIAAQSDRGAITGKVKDPTGAVVANAKVTAVNVETNEAREVTTNDEGSFTIPQLQAARTHSKRRPPGSKRPRSKASKSPCR